MLFASHRCYLAISKLASEQQVDAKGKISGKGLDRSGLLGVIKSMVLLNVRAIGTMTFSWTLSFFLRALDFYLLKKKEEKRKK